MSLVGHLFLDHALRLLLLGLGQLALEVRDHAVGELAGTVVVAAALRLRQLVPRLLELLLELLRLVMLAFLGLPLRGQRRPTAA